MAPKGFNSIWLPQQQEHGVGQLAQFNPLRGDIHRGAMWTDDDQKPGALATSPWQTLPAGEYVGLLQHWSNTESSQPLGTFQAEDGRGKALGSTSILAHEVETGAWQRTIVTFKLARPTRARLRFDYSGTAEVWTGSMRLQRGGPRPFYVIGHNRNTPEQVNESLAKGANAIEVDVTYRDGRMVMAETPPWPNWTVQAPIDDWLANIMKQRQRWAFIYFDCKSENVPGDDFAKFGRELAGHVKRAGLDPAVCVFSVPDVPQAAVHQAVASSGFAASATGMDGLHNSAPDSVHPELWSKVALEHRLAFLGLGRPSWDITTPLAKWWAPLQATLNARDQGGRYPAKVIYWSLDDKEGMRKVLDLGVDGLITDHEDRLTEVLLEEPYRHLCRKALPSEWSAFVAHGVGS